MDVLLHLLRHCAKFSVAGSGSATASGLSITAPVQYQVFQRNASSNANITISGNVGTGTHDLEARFNQGPWQTVATGASGTYSVTLSNQFQGQGFVQVRCADTPNAVAFVPNVGVGEVFVISGQSNASGRGSNNQTTGDYPTPFVSMLGNDYTWQLCKDPTDSNVGQVDTVSSDASAAGSLWPMVGGQLSGALGVPVALIPCSLGATSVTDWQPSGGATNRSSLYGSMVWRAKYANPGGVRAVLWWQGEQDAAASMSQADYYSNFTNFTANVATDIGCKVIPCKLQNSSSAPVAAGQAAINSAIGQAWASNVNTSTGPDLTGINTAPEDPVHLITTAKLSQAAALWKSALQTVYGW